MTTEPNTLNVEPVVENKKNRSFKVVSTLGAKQSGRYNGDSPYQAANKALSEIIRNRIKNGLPTDSEISFYLIESTKGSNRKIHRYKGIRTKLETPVQYDAVTKKKVKSSDGAEPVIEIKKQTIIKQFKNALRKIKKNEISEFDTEQYNNSQLNESSTQPQEQSATPSATP